MTLVYLELLALLVGAFCGYVPLYLARREVEGMCERARELDMLNAETLEFITQALPRVQALYREEVARKELAYVLASGEAPRA